MTAADRGARVRAITLQWYRTRARDGMQAADAEHDAAFATYLAELDTAESPRQREARLWSDVAIATIAARRTLQISDRGYAAIMRALLSA